MIRIFPGISTGKKSQVTYIIPTARAQGLFPCLISHSQLPLYYDPHSSSWSPCPGWASKPGEYGKNGEGNSGGVFSPSSSCPFYESVSSGLPPVSLIFPVSPGSSIIFLNIIVPQDSVLSPHPCFLSLSRNFPTSRTVKFLWLQKINRVSSGSEHQA